MQTQHFAPSDYVFSPLKFLAGQRLISNDMKTAVQQRFGTQVAEFYNSGIPTSVTMGQVPEPGW
jgi:hypothetical protein